MPCEGIWLVRSDRGRYDRPNSWSCIMRIGELPELFPYAQLAMWREELANFVVHNRDKCMSAQSFVDAMLMHVAELEHERTKMCKELTKCLDK